MKKKMAALLALAAFAGASAIAIGCDDNPEKKPTTPAHTEHHLVWDHDDDQHWQYCDFSGCDYETEKVDHDDKKDADGEAGVDGVCDDCGYVIVAPHDHVTAKTSDDDYHWEYCTVDKCQYTANKAAHEDKIINDTEAAGKDGLCDACDRVIKYTVTFDGNGHNVTLPTAQRVEHGDTATAPDDLEDDGRYPFVGWVGEDKETPFDFENTIITEDTVVYAKWGAAVGSENNPIAIGLSQQKLYEFSKGETLYYEFTATKAYRYTISLRGGAAQKSRFTTNLDEEDVWYGNGCDASVKYVDVAADGKVKIAVTCLNDLAADDMISAFVSETTDEPLPADKYLDGTYASGKIKLIIDRATKSVTYNENTAWYSYAGGDVDKFTFVVTGEGGVTTYYFLKPVDDNTFRLGWAQQNAEAAENNANTENASSSALFTPYVPAAPIEISKFSGIYKPAEDDGLRTGLEGEEYISAVVIDASGSGYYDILFPGSMRTRNRCSIANGIFDQEFNELSYGPNRITLNFDNDGEVESITIVGDIDQKTYARIGDAPAVLPERIPLEQGTYKGENYSVIRQLTYSTYWGSMGNDSLDVDGYDGSEWYTVSFNQGYGDTVYKLKQTSDNKVLIYSEDGTELIDTLSKLEYPALPATGEKQTVNVADFEQDFYVYEVKKAAWYAFSNDEGQEGFAVYPNVDPDGLEYAAYGTPITLSKQVYLKEGSFVGIYKGDMAEYEGETISFTIAETAPPAGLSENDPIIVADGKAKTDMTNEDNYYFSFTAPTAGDYIINFALYESGDFLSNEVFFVINGTEYGVKAVFDPDWGYDVPTWIVITEAYPYLKLTLAQGEKIDIVADRKATYAENAEVTLTIVPANSDNTPLDLTANTLEAGSYICNDGFTDGAVGLDLTSENEFTVTVFGEELTGTSIRLTETQIKLGFTLSGNVNMALAYIMGTPDHPHVIDAADVNEYGVIHVEVQNGDMGFEATYITITAGDNDLEFSVPSDGEGPYATKFYFAVKGEDGQYDKVYGYTVKNPDDFNIKYESSDLGDKLIIKAHETVSIKVGTEVPYYFVDELGFKLIEVEAND